MLELHVVFRKGKVLQSLFGKLITRVAIFRPSQVRDAGIQAVASIAAFSGFFNVFVCGCAAAALASAFAYLLAFDVGISAAAACVYVCTLVFVGTSVLSSVLRFWI